MVAEVEIGRVETVSTQIKPHEVFILCHEGYSGGGGGGGGGGGQPPMMGNNQPYNSPAPSAHPQPPFKYNTPDHHSAPAPLVSGPSPVAQPGCSDTRSKLSDCIFYPGGTAMQSQQVTIPTHVSCLLISCDVIIYYYMLLVC